MASVNYVPSTVVMGLLVIGVAVALVRVANWRQRPTATSERGGRTGDDGGDVLLRYGSVVGAATRNPTTWYVGFFVLVAGFVGGTIALVTSPPKIGGVVFSLLGLAFAAVLCGFLVWGIYTSGRYRGLESAQAALAGAWALGALLILAIAVKLLTTSP